MEDNTIHLEYKCWLCDSWQPLKYSEIHMYRMHDRKYFTEEKLRNHCMMLGGLETREMVLPKNK